MNPPNNLFLPQRIRIWTMRKHDGKLAFPLCVRAHISEILHHAPHLITEDEITRITEAYE